MSAPLATTDDVADLWRPLSADEETRVGSLIAKASAKLRHACPFDIDARIALFTTDPSNPQALDPTVVADRVAIIVHRYLVNQDGAASLSEGVGGFSRSITFVNRYDKTGADVRGELRITDEDIDELRPAVPAPVPSSIRVNVPCPQVLYPHGYGSRDGMPGVPVVTPDPWPGSGVE